jgi:hypothetical protein
MDHMFVGAADVSPIHAWYETVLGDPPGKRKTVVYFHRFNVSFSPR